MVTLMPWMLGLLTAVIIAWIALRQKTTQAKLGVAALAVVGFGAVQFAATRYLQPLVLGYQFEESLRTEPLFQMIAKADPVAYAKFLQQVKGQLKDNPDPEIITQSATTLVNSVFFQYVDKAPDEALYHYLQATVELYRYLLLINPGMVLTLENPRYLGVKNVSDVMNDPTFQSLFLRVLNAKQQIIMLGINHPIEAPAATDKSENVLKPVFETLAQKYTVAGVKKMLGPTQLTVPPIDMANFIIDFYTVIINEGPEKAATMLRALSKGN